MRRTAYSRGWAHLAYLLQRGLPTTPQLWKPEITLIGTLEKEGTAGITASRLWAVLRRFFKTAADQMDTDSPALAEKLRRATTHWMRHTHATHALAKGAELTTVRDNLRHSFVHRDDVALSAF